MKTSNRNTNLNLLDWVALICLGAFLLLFNYKSKGQGVVEWKTNYTNTFSQYDKGLAIVTDADCNSYIAGTTWNGMNLDYLIVKLNHKGDTLWTRTYNGTGNGDDTPTAMAKDAAGNIFVTGESMGPGTGFDYATLKINKTTGMIMNSHRYGNSFDDHPVKLMVASNNEVIVTGYGINHHSSNSNQDFLTIRYSSSLALLCTAAGNGGFDNNDKATSLAINTAGTEYYVLGSSDKISGTTKYWYKNSVNQGTPNCTFSYNSDGGTFGTYRPNNILLSASNKLFVIGTWEDDMILRRYDNPANLFLNNYAYEHIFSNTGTTLDEYTGMIMDPSGANIYVCGFLDADPGAGINNNIVVAKYNSSATPGAAPLWVSTPFNGTGNGEDKPVAIFLDNSPTPNVYIAGYSKKANGVREIILLKYNSAGALIATINLAHTSSFDEICTGAARDNYGNILITGYNDDPSGQQLIAAKICNNSFNPAITWTSLNTLSSTSGDSYQWFLNGTMLAGEDNQTINITGIGNGNYMCEVTKFCCTFNTSMVVATVGLDDLFTSNQQLLIYPNPATDYIDITWNSNEQIESLKIIDMSGRVVLENEYVVMDGRVRMITGTLKSGIYFIELSFPSNKLISRIIKI